MRNSFSETYPIKRISDRQMGTAGILRNDKIGGATVFDSGAGGAGGAGGDPMVSMSLEMRGKFASRVGDFRAQKNG